MSDQTPDLNALFAQAAQMQEQLVAARDAAAAQNLVGSAANGAVTVTVSGAMEFKAVHIDPSVIDDAEMLEDLVLAALRDAAAKVDALNQSAMGGMFG